MISNYYIDREKFFFNLKAKKLFVKFTQLQVDSIDAILNECELQGVPMLAQVAYILATAYHECHNPRKPELRLTPMREFGGENYLRTKPYYPYYGRGFSQLTWPKNYAKEGKRIGLDLLNNPDKMLYLAIAANSHVYCIMHGTYTGKALTNYVNNTKVDFLNARRVVNGKDKAQLIASYAQAILACLQ